MKCLVSLSVLLEKKNGNTKLNYKGRENGRKNLAFNW